MRVLLAGLILLLGAGVEAQQAPAPDQPWRHGLSLAGELRYPAGFPHFDYVNPNAPRGGIVRMASEQGFDSFNFFIPRGSAAPGLQLIYQQLMESSLDEVSAAYGDLAEAVRHPDDFSSVTYRLRDGARWHDGQPITPADVVWSFERLVELNPSQRFYYRNVVRAEATGEREVTFTFDAPGNREKPAIMGQIYVLPRHWWTANGPDGRPRDITQTTLEPPLGSGAYRIERFEPNRTVTYRRVEDWWAARVPVNVGRHNLDQIRYDVYRDGTVALEAFKGDNLDWRTENSARQWATQYDFPALRDGRVVLETFPDRGTGRMQGFAFNLRRDRFQDARVRLAFNHAFDFEEANRNLFYGFYRRIDSYFAGSDLASSGLPQGLELEILNAVRDRVPAEVFTTPYRNPAGGTPQATRDNLREAQRLLQAAGWTTRGRELVNARTGERFRVEILLNSPAFERIVLPYKQQLERLGMEVTVRLVDSSQYVNRLRTRDFDVIVQSWPQSLSPGNEQRDFWGSASAEREGSRNVVGIQNPAVDALIERLVFARDRPELEAATRALDRVLLWNHYVVPQWMLGSTWSARWNRYGHPANLPRYGFGFPDIWWWDEELARRTGGGRS